MRWLLPARVSSLSEINSNSNASHIITKITFIAQNIQLLIR